MHELWRVKELKIMEAKQDILTRKDIETLVDQFYERIRNNEVIGYIFNDVAKTNWEVHLPKMYDFWEVILFGTGRFKGNPMLVHKEVHDKSPMSEVHFQHWLALFHDTVDSLFEGANAEDIKYSSSNIAKSLMYRVLNMF